MTPGANSRRQATRRERLELAGAKYRRALGDRNDAIVDAVQGGLSYRDVGAAVGLSHEAVRKIYEGRLS